MNSTLWALVCSLSVTGLANAQQGTWTQDQFANATPSLVHVQTPGATGTGFVVSDRHHVVTPLHVVNAARPVRVRVHGGAFVSARIVAVDPDADLALLRTTDSLAEPLRLHGPPAEGSAILSIGPALVSVADEHDTDEHDNWAVTQGVLSAIGSERLQLALSGVLGGPIIDQEGRVVGIATSREGQTTFASLAEAIDDLIDAEPTQTAYRGRWRPLLEVQGTVQVEDGQAFGGATLGMGALARDRFGIVGRVGMLAMSSQTQGTITARSTSRLTLALEAQYRLQIPSVSFPLHLVFGVGLWSAFEMTSETTERYSFPGGCDPTAEICDADRFTTVTSSTRWLARPALRLGINVGDAVSLSYGVQIDVRRPRNTAHTFNLGFSF